MEAASETSDTVSDDGEVALVLNENGYHFHLGALGSHHSEDTRMTLDQLQPGDCADVTVVGGHGPFRRRLLELGILPGTLVERTGQAPMGDPLTFRIRGAVLCLRRTEAATIEVDGARELAAK
jgi:Fe2+ transport system protein FeoA